MSNRNHRYIPFDKADVQLLLMLQRGCKPTFITLAVIETRFTVTQSVSSGTTHLATIIVMFFLILQCIILSRYVFVRFAFHTDANVVITYILADFDRLFVCFAVIQQLDCKGMVLNNFRFSVFQKSAYLAKTEGRH